MAESSVSNSPESFSNFQLSIERLGRPIQLAGRTSSNHLSSFKNLGNYVSSQVVKILGELVLPSGVETHLLALRQLFLDYDGLPIGKERQARVVQGQAILGRLQSYSGSKSEQKTHSQIWEIPIQFAKGVGPNRARLLEKLGIITIEDALWFLPWRYEDRSVISPINQLQIGMKATVCGTVQSSTLRRTSRRRFVVLTVAIADSTGLLHCVYFNQPFLENTFSRGTNVLVTGVVSVGSRAGKTLQMTSPQYEVLDGEVEGHDDSGRIIPIYHETRGLTSRQFRRIMKGLFPQYQHALQEILPKRLLSQLGLPEIGVALAHLHFPGVEGDVEALNLGTTPAHRRLAFEEFFILQLALGVRRRLVKKEIGIPFIVENPLMGQLRGHLPFQLTPSQQKVIQEIAQDMAQPECMSRLLQGDVGSGKTLVALHAVVMACGSGYQSVLMAPTEVLSEQHFLTLSPIFRAIGLNPILFKGGQSEKERMENLEQLSSGKAHIAIGTHALLQPDVRFANLGLVVVDEQHKFGVLQRAILRNKGVPRPDVLVMTATPIPRTLAMTVYGDLDVSVIDELPPGRKPVRTMLFREADKKRAYSYLRKEIETGRQAYVVYPLVEVSEKMDLDAAIQAADRLKTEEFPGKPIGLLHGRMKQQEKQSVMARFKAGDIQILVTTTIIEVGLDVSNATVMLVEHAERFGLAQLHQLRGRVGRGGEQSFCLLVSAAGGKRSVGDPSTMSREFPFAVEQHLYGSAGMSSKTTSQTASRRLQVLARCTDGFVLAEEDLKIRGPGDFLGVKQWGEIDFRVANLLRDQEVLERARRAAHHLLEGDPLIARQDHQGLKAAMVRRWGAKFDLGSIG